MTTEDRLTLVIRTRVAFSDFLKRKEKDAYLFHKSCDNLVEIANDIRKNNKILDCKEFNEFFCAENLHSDDVMHKLETLINSKYYKSAAWIILNCFPDGGSTEKCYYYTV